MTRTDEIMPPIPPTGTIEAATLDGPLRMLHIYIQTHFFFQQQHETKMNTAANNTVTSMAVMPPISPGDKPAIKPEHHNVITQA